MTRTRLAIIGNGMAASRLLDEIIKRGSTHLDISVFGEEPHGSYNRILLGRVIAGAKPAEITLKSDSWYIKNGVTLHIGNKVTELDTGARKLITEEGVEHRYDAAVFATGSAAIIPPMSGIKSANGPLPGVFVFRTVADCEAIRSYTRPAMSAVVLGGGLLGLEAAASLTDLGLYVTVVHQADWLMNRQLDETAGKYLQRAIERLGMFVRTGVRATGVKGQENLEGVILDNGEMIPADVLVMAVGVRPRVELATAAKVPVNKGIVVNNRLSTAVPGISAVGECAEHNGIVYGIVPPIWEQCEVLADLLTGHDLTARYQGSKQYTRLKVAGVDVAQMGVAIPAEDDEVVQIVEERRQIYRNLIIRNDVLVGATLVGDASTAPSLSSWFDRGDPLPQNRLDLFSSGDGPKAVIDREICNCHKVCESTIRAAIRNGCTNLVTVGETTKAGTGCGSCRGSIADLILSTPSAVE